MSPERRAYKRDVVIETTAKVMVPLISLFGMYLIVGTDGAGGGFPGGCVLAAAFILYITAFGTEMGRERMPESWNTFFTSLGMHIYCGVGFLAIIFSYLAVWLGIHPGVPAQFLNFSAVWPLAELVGIAKTRYYLIVSMVSVGVGITVMAAFVSQFFDLAWKEEEEKEKEEEEEKKEEGEEV